MNDYVSKLSIKPGTMLKKFGAFKNTWRKWCTVSKSTPGCDRYMDSIAAFTAERRRHASLKQWWIIHPFSYMRFLWDMIMTAIYSIAFLTIPFMVSFVVMDHEKVNLDKVNLPIYALCWLDIICNCITGYNDKKNMEIELRPLKIMKYYLKGFLLPDVLSSLPYDHVTLPWRRLPGHDSYYIVTLINVLPLLKLIRYRTLKYSLSQLFTHLEITSIQYETCSMLLLAFYLVFWFACLCYLLPVMLMHFLNTSASECEDCWMTELENESLSLRFQHALFIALENISASGFGLFTPRRDGHIVLGAIFMVIGRVMECFIIVTFLQIKAGRKASESKFQEIMNQLSAYASQKQLPKHMTTRLLAYYYYRFKNSYFREKLILSNLSEHLREEIALQSCRRLVENVAIFKDLPKEILQSIVKNLKFELYLPNDVIVKAGSQGDCMFFLSTGTVAVLTATGTEICHLDDGAYFGEIALLVPDQRRVASVVAIEVCEVYQLDRKDFRKCIAMHSELFAKIERIAMERIQRAVVVEEQHKHYLMRGSYIADESQKKGKRRKTIVG